MRAQPQTVVVIYKGGSDFLVNNKPVKAFQYNQPVSLTANERQAFDHFLENNWCRFVQRSIYFV
jgi:hypothetical protein